MTTAPGTLRQKPSVCFVALKSYAVLSGRDDIPHVGGAEVQQTLIARELVRRGHRVSFIVLDHRQPDGEQFDGISVYKAYRPDAGLRGVRFVHPRITALWSAMRRADTDVYYQRGAGTETGVVANWCRRHRRRFVFAVAADPSCPRDLTTVRGLRDRCLYRYGLRCADGVVAQTLSQQRQLRDSLGRDSVLIASCCADAGDTAPTCPGPSRPARALWLGRLVPIKGLDYLLRMAEQCPTIQFELIGDTAPNSAYARQIVDRAQSMANVVLHGRVPHHDVQKYYRGAAALLCTSESEGFPNTFVEAWSHGVPVVTRWDPESVVKTHGLGVADSNEHVLAQKMMDLIGSPQEWRACSRRVRAFFLDNHTIRTVVDAYEHLFNELSISSSPDNGDRA